MIATTEEIPSQTLTVPPPRTPAGPGLPSAEKVREDLDGKATPEQVDTIVDLLEEARRRGITTFEGIGKIVNRDGTTISRVMRGKYEADLQPLCIHLRSYLEDCATGANDEEPFVEGLSIVQTILPFCDLVRSTRQIGIIWGENQTGKSKTLEYYSSIRTDSPYARLPGGGSAKRSFRVIATAHGIAEGNADGQLRDRILKRVTPRTLPIIDEFHQAVNGRTIKTDTVERIREIHDLCGCGIVLCGTHVVNEMMEDKRFKRFLGQIDNRGVLRLNIPKAPTAKDRALLIEAYKLPRPDANTASVVKEICNGHGIARLTDYFKVARRLAINASQPFGWEHFHMTLTTLKAWASGIRSKEEE